VTFAGFHWSRGDDAPSSKDVGLSGGCAHPGGFVGAGPAAPKTDDAKAVRRLLALALDKAAIENMASAFDGKIPAEPPISESLI